MSNQVAIVPAGLQLPAHLQGPDVAAQIAAANAAAAGGIKTGGFPSISIKANKFHIKDGGEVMTLMNQPQAGQPALPMMCLEIVVVAANAAITKTYFPGDWVEGADDQAPDCRSSNGVTPDADIPVPQNNVCATCPKNQWGSKVSKLSGKDIKACDDSKQLAVLPASDLAYKALGLQVKKGSLTNWGGYVRALTERGYPLEALVTNVTFDATANGILQFAFNRFLSVEEYAKVKERASGSDVKLIVAQSRVIAPSASALPPPAPTFALPLVTPIPTVTVGLPSMAPGGTVHVHAGTAPVTVQPSGTTIPPGATAQFGSAPSAPPAVPPYTPPPAPPAPPAAPPVGFGAAPAPAAPPAPATPPPAEPPKRTRRTRAQIAADNAAAVSASAQYAPPPAAPPVDLSHLPPAIAAAVTALGPTSPAGQALLAQFPAAPAIALVAPPAAVAPAPVQVTPPVVLAPPAGFGAAPTPTPAQAQPTAQVVSSGASLAAVLAAKLGLPAPAGA